MMKIYISLPITDHDIEEVEASWIYASGVIQAKGHTPVSPLDLDHRDPEFYEAVIGTDITALLLCDAVLFMDGWKSSRGCRLEYAAAEIYGKQVFCSLDRIPHTGIKPPESCPYHVKDFKECKYQCETIIGKGKRKINCTCDYYTKNMLIEIENLKIK